MISQSEYILALSVFLQPEGIEVCINKRKHSNYTAHRLAVFAIVVLGTSYKLELMKLR